MFWRLVAFVGWLPALLVPGTALAQSGYLDMKPDAEMGGWVMQASRHFDDFRERFSVILGRMPEVPADWIAAGRRLFAPAGQGASPVLVLSLAVAIAFGMARTGIGMRKLLQRRDRGEHSPAMAALLRLLYDMFGLVTGFAISVVVTSTLFARQSLDAQFAASLLWCVLIWAAARYAINLMLRPDEPRIRLIPFDDAVARRIGKLMEAGAAIAIFYNKLIYVFMAHGLPLESAQGTALLVGACVGLLLLAALLIAARALKLQRNWLLPVGLGVLATALLAWFGAVVMVEFTIFNAVVYSIGAAWLILAIDRLLDLALLPAADGAAEAGPAVARQRRAAMIRAVQRSLLAIAGTVTLVELGRVWAVGVLRLVPAERWGIISRALALGLAVAVAGYVLYQTLKAWSAAPAAPSFGAPDSEVHPQSRLATILPILTGALLAGSLGIAVLVTLSELGVNTAPLLAGAGIFGLALSFGSQSLVRDIVSGIFYMADDAFRVGEYIESGRLKGTVEKIMVRSLRLRHQNGQIHTIPYGQLGAVTNYSRDWSTLKFNLRLARHVDIEQVRKTAKKVGEQLLEEPEFAGEFLEPLKLQGVADVTENAIICRFKLTVRPFKPSEIQREALKRLYYAFSEKGIPFAAHAVTVRSEDAAQQGSALAVSAAAAAQVGDLLAPGEDRLAAQSAS